jgi:hypothetical protein
MRKDDGGKPPINSAMHTKPYANNKKNTLKVSIQENDNQIKPAEDFTFDVFKTLTNERGEALTNDTKIPFCEGKIFEPKVIVWDEITTDFAERALDLSIKEIYTIDKNGDITLSNIEIKDNKILYKGTSTEVETKQFMIDLPEFINYGNFQTRYRTQSDKELSSTQLRQELIRGQIGEGADGIKTTRADMEKIDTARRAVALNTPFPFVNDIKSKIVTALSTTPLIGELVIKGKAEAQRIALESSGLTKLNKDAAKNAHEDANALHASLLPGASRTKIKRSNSSSL